jgi:hypothetical protein
VAIFNPLPKEAEKAALALTVEKPAHGMVVGPGGIRCGSVDAACSMQYQEGTEVTLSAFADPEFVFRGFTGDCSSSGKTVMNSARTCGATFVPDQKSARTPSNPSIARDRPQRAPTRAGGTSGTAIDSLPMNPPGGNTTDPLAGGDTRSRVATPLSAEELAKKDITKLIEEYRDAYERLDVTGVQRTYPSAPVGNLRTAFSSYRSLKYALEGSPEFVDVDPGRGIARVRAKFLLTPEVKVGSQPPYKREETFNLELRNGVWLIREWAGKIIK